MLCKAENPPAATGGARNCDCLEAVTPEIIRPKHDLQALRPSPPAFAATKPSDAQLIACDAIVEFASILCGESAALLAAAAAADVPAVEARLWACRRTLTAAIQSWREAVPAPSNEGARHG